MERIYLQIKRLLNPVKTGRVALFFLFETSLTNQDEYCIMLIESEVMDMALLEIIEKVTTIILNILSMLEIKKRW